MDKIRSNANGMKLHEAGSIVMRHCMSEGTVRGIYFLGHKDWMYNEDESVLHR